MDELNRVSDEIRELKEHIRRLSKSDTFGFTEKIECAKLELECLKMMFTTSYETHRLKLQEEHLANNPPYRGETNEH